MTSKQPKMLCFAIDAGDKDLIQSWAQEGDLPNFSRLFETSAWATTEAPLGFEASSTWPSFYTGALPSRNGQYNGLLHFDPETYRDEVLYQPAALHRPFWSALCDNDRKVVIIDAPYTYLDEDINAVQIVDWGTHARQSGRGLQVAPHHLRDKVIARFGRDEIGESDSNRPRTAHEHDEFRRKLIDRIDRKCKLSAHLMHQVEWDLFLVAFGEAHSAGHCCWHLNDDNHPQYDSQLTEAVGNPLKDIYVQLDQAIGDLQKQAGSDVTLSVFCSHGMGPHYSGTRLLDDILLALEGRPPRQVRDSTAVALRGPWMATPRPLRTALRPLRDFAVRLLVENEKEGRQYFEVMNNNATGAIRLNVIGRERNGRVKPGAEYDAVSNRLISELLSLTNADTGQPLVNDAVKTADHYHGARVGNLPDILVNWNREAAIERAYSPAIGTIENKHASGRTGDHRPEGLFLVNGPGIRAGQLNRKLPVIDIAPSLLAYFGVTLDDIDGAPARELLWRLSHELENQT